MHKLFPSVVQIKVILVVCGHSVNLHTLEFRLTPNTYILLIHLSRL